MISSSRGAADHTPKQEDKTSEGKIISKAAAAAASSSSISWSRLRDPRIVRVSRAFGGKDRHSKVCTVRGLRDRRVRLSVPTAVQLYDLQDRLGLNQPSKVIDWLLNAAKHEIDELPPLQMPPGNFSQIHHPMPSTNSHDGLMGHDNSQSAAERQLNINNWNDPSELSASNYWSTNSDRNFRDHMKSKEIVEERRAANDKESWTKRIKQGDLEHQGRDHAYNSSNNFFARVNHSESLTGLLNNVMPVLNSSFLRWDPSNLSLSHTEDHPHQNFNFVPILPSNSLSMPSGSHQFVVYPPADGEFDPKQMINFQMLSSGTSTSKNSPLSNSSFTPPLYTVGQAMRPFHLSMNPYGGSAPTKDD